MSYDAPATPDGGLPHADPPHDVEVAAVIDHRDIRRAPRYRAFFAVGVLCGLVLGAIIAIVWITSPRADYLFKPGVYVSIIIAGTTMITTALAGWAAVVADRRSLRSGAGRRPK